MREERIFCWGLNLLLVAIVSCGGNIDDLALTKYAENEESTEVLRPPINPRVIKVGNAYKTGMNVVNGLFYEDAYQMAQGMAIADSVLYRFFTSGICTTYDITDVENPIEIATFYLGSHSEVNHSNSAQFFVDETGERLLYLSGMGGKCYVEAITDTSSRLVQTIILDKIKILKNSLRVNMLCGDDGTMWLFGIDNEGTMLVFARAKRPDSNYPIARITNEDILDYWYGTNYCYQSSLAQGGKMYGGNLFFVFGSEKSDRHLDVYNVYSHEIAQRIDLNELIVEEPEDCDLMGESLIITVAGGRGYYVLDLIE